MHEVTTQPDHQLPALLSIDHIAVLRPRRCVARHVVAEVDQTRLSDHDVYLVDVPYGGDVALQ